ncbi:MAG: LamG domain-containing protein [Candidatus Nanohaloarchaea archaeon]
MDKELEELIQERAEEIAEEKIQEGKAEEPQEEIEDVEEERRGLLKEIALGAGTIAFASLGAAELFKITDRPTKSDVNADSVDGHELMSGSLSGRPSAGTSGRIFYATDGQGVYYDNGSSWTQVSAAGGLGVTVSMDVTLNGQSASLTVLEDTDNDGVAENRQTVSLADGSNSYSLDQLDGSAGNEVWLVWHLSSNKTSTPSVNSGDVSGNNWNSDAEWDNAASISGTSHEEVPNTDTSTPGTVSKGHSYEKFPLSNGLVGWWPLTYTSGSAYDLSGNNNDGTTNGSVTRGVAGKAGVQAYSFDGTDDSVSGSLSITKDAISMVAWARPTVSGANQADYAKVFELNDGATKAWLQVHSSSVWDVGIRNSSGTTFAIVQGSSDVQADRWYHLAATYDGSNTALYVDGQSVDTASSSDTMADLSGFGIGANVSNSNQRFQGNITDARIYNRALSSSEIQTLYNMGSQDLAQPPANSNGGVSYYPLDGDATDSWGSNDGTVNGATSTGNAIRGSAYDFNGSGDYITTTASISSGLTTYSMGAWVYPNNSSASEEHVVQIGDSGAGIPRSMLIWRGDKLALYAEDGTNAVDLRPSMGISVNNWYHAFFVRDGSSFYLYVNGEGVATGSNSSIGDTTDGDTLTVGRANDGTSYFDGVIDQVRLYNRALKPREIQQLYRYGTRGIDMSKHMVRQ